MGFQHGLRSLLIIIVTALILMMIWIVFNVKFRNDFSIVNV